MSDVSYSNTVSLYCYSSFYSDCEEIMRYVIKGFLITEGTGQLDCRFELIAPDFANVIEFLNKVCLYEAYDYVKVIPFDTEV